jgi:hypothetical protein
LLREPAARPASLGNDCGGKNVSAERSRQGSRQRCAKRLGLDGEHGDGKRRALFKQAGHPNHCFLKNGIRANVFS